MVLAPPRPPRSPGPGDLPSPDVGTPFADPVLTGVRLNPDLAPPARGPGADAAGPAPSPAGPVPSPAGPAPGPPDTAAEPDDIEFWYTRPERQRRRRRRRLAIAVVLVTVAVTWAGVGGLRVRALQPSAPGRAYAPASKSVIIQARARQRRRRKRIAVAAAPIVGGAAGWAAAGGPHSRLWPRSAPRPARPPPPSRHRRPQRRQPARLGMRPGWYRNRFGRHPRLGDLLGRQGLGNTVLEFDASTGAFVAEFAGASYGFDQLSPLAGIASDRTHVWVADVERRPRWLGDRTGRCHRGPGQGPEWAQVRV